jgi:hypothetical protein
MKMNDVECRAFLDLLMCSDPYPCQGEEILKNLADREARKLDFEDWIAAYHFLEAHKKDFAANLVKRIEEASLQPMREITMLPHQQRVIDEKTELDERLGKLTAFFDTDLFPNFPQAEQDRMRRQAKHMKCYSDILGERIEAFPQ